MALLALISAYNEEGLLADAVRSALAAGVDEVHVFDGAWRAAGPTGPAFANARRPGSTDRTGEVARSAGARVHPARRLWDDQGAKRSAMFQRCGARKGDHLLVLDADERVAGYFPDRLPPGHLNVLLKSIGENDLPGIRGVFPKGDYSPKPRPCLRLFAWEPELRCLQPGDYFIGDLRVIPYDDIGGSLLPVIDQVLIEHHPNLRSAERLEAKRSYYEAEHPVRRDRLEDALVGLPWWKGANMEAGLAPKTVIVDTANGRRIQIVAGTRIPGSLADAYEKALQVEAKPRPQAAAKSAKPKRRASAKRK